MVSYADYQFYTEEYGGDLIAEKDFPRLSALATAFIRSWTRGLSDSASEAETEAVKTCTCAVAEIFQDEARMQSGAFSGEGVKSSESVGPWSVSYSSGLSQLSLDYIDRRRREILYMYLGTLPRFKGLFQTEAYRCTHDAERRRRRR